MKFRGILILFFFLMVIKGWSFGAIVSIYVDNKPVVTECVFVSGEIYIPSDVLLAAYKEKIVWNSDTLWISINNRELPLKALLVENIVYLPMKALAKVIRYPVEWDEEKAVLNIITSKKNDVPEDLSNKIVRSGGVSIGLFQEDLITNVLKQCTAMRIFAEVKNEKGRAVSNIEAECVFRYPGGEIYFDDRVVIEKLNPGESKRVVFYSINPLPEEKLEYELKVKVMKKQQD